MWDKQDKKEDSEKKSIKGCIGTTFFPFFLAVFFIIHIIAYLAANFPDIGLALNQQITQFFVR